MFYWTNYQGKQTRVLRLTVRNYRGGSLGKWRETILHGISPFVLVVNANVSLNWNTHKIGRGREWKTWSNIPASWRKKKIIKKYINIKKWLKWSKVLKLFHFAAGSAWLRFYSCWPFGFPIAEQEGTGRYNILQILATFSCAITNHFPTISFTSNFNLT